VFEHGLAGVMAAYDRHLVRAGTSQGKQLLLADFIQELTNAQLRTIKRYFG